MGFRRKGRQQPPRDPVEGRDDEEGQAEAARDGGRGDLDAGQDARVVRPRCARATTASPMTDPRPDVARQRELVELARGGDLDAFDSLVRLHFARIYALLFRMIGNHEDAEDLAQETFLRAQSSLKWFRGEARLSTWLCRIALHLSRDHFRKRSRSQRSLSELGTAEGEGFEPVSAGQGPAAESARRELSRGLRACLERLPHKLRAAIVLRTQEGLEYDEIAEILAVSPQTARVHVMKARRRLERWLEPWTRGEGGASC